MMENFLGIDIGGTFIKYGIVDGNDNVIKKWKVETKLFETKDLFYDYLCENAGNLEEVSTIGISAPGVIDSESNVTSYAAPNVVIMFGTNVNDEVSRRTKKRVATINDARAAGLCEFSIGNASKAKSAAIITLGTGTGGCLCGSEGIIAGVNGLAGVLHHIPTFDPVTKKVGHLGDYCSVTGLIEIYNKKATSGSVKSGKEICELYLLGNETAVASVDEWTSNISVLLLSLTFSLNPEVVCFGGGITEQSWLIKLIDEKFKKLGVDYFELEIITTKIKVCKYKNDANILGAVMNAKK